MRDRYLMLIALVIILLPLTALAWQGEVPRTNPFERPASEEEHEKEPEANAGEAPQSPMELRGTMAAGRHSLADIGGEILAIGQEINGYRLVAVHQRHVVLEKDDTRQVLSIDREEQR